MRRRLFKVQGVLFTAFGVTLVVLGIMYNPVLVFLSVIFFLAGVVFVSVGVKTEKKTKTRRRRVGGGGSEGFSAAEGRERRSQPHEVLGVETDASEDEIESAYRDLVKEVHPDLNDSDDADEEFRRVQEAYETLKNQG
ncbi:MAG: DnaJ domain-containing protein [Halobacteria archaeon]|nr:DnaJ domain-containing protein [Halobacteria archaeon]